MADDTVADARLRLTYVLDDYWDTLSDVPAVAAAIDALIAAVRAEQRDLVNRNAAAAVIAAQDAGYVLAKPDESS